MHKRGDGLPFLLGELHRREAGGRGSQSPLPRSAGPGAVVHRQNPEIKYKKPTL
jgi:hypothetical protein